MDYTSAISTLKAYKELTQDQNNHRQLLKDKTVILYVATLLDSKNKEILNLCLNILEDFLKNVESHEALTLTFGIIEALEFLAIRLRHSDWAAEARHAGKLINTLRNSSPPAYNTRSKLKNNNTLKQTVYLLQLDSLKAENRHKLEYLLARTRGLISFMMDLEKKRCAVRIDPQLSIKGLMARINAVCKMKPYLVTCNAENVETLVNILDDKGNESLGDYPDFNSPPIKTNAISTISCNPEDQSGWFKSVTNFWSSSFYW